MRLQWLAAVLRDEGLTVVEKPGWETRGADTMTPKAVVIHHTGSGVPSSEGRYADFLIAGRSDLPGPLSQLYLDRAGRYWVLAAGRANHAGRGGWKGIRGNSSVIGIEAGNNGRGEAWPEVQLDAYVRGVAAILRKLGRNAEFVCGHREWAEPPGRKPDPVGINLDEFRAKVARLLEPVALPVDQLTPKEIAKLRDLIASWESVGSNPTFPQYLIADYRRRNR